VRRADALPVQIAINVLPAPQLPIRSFISKRRVVSFAVFIPLIMTAHRLLMHGLRLTVLAIAAVSLPAGLLHGAAPPTNAAFDAYVGKLADDWLRADPVAATTSQYFTGAEQDALDRKLNAKDFQYGTPLDFAERVRRVEAARVGLEQLQRYSPAELSPEQRASRAMLTWKLRDTIRVSDLTDHRFVFEQFRGLQVGLVNFLSQTHPVRNVRDVENYLERLAQVAPLLDQGVVEARARAGQGIIPPKFILKSTLDGIDRFLAPEPAKNVLVASLDERMAKVKDIRADSGAAFLAAAEKIVRDAIIPSFQRVRALLAEQMETRTTMPASGGSHVVPKPMLPRSPRTRRPRSRPTRCTRSA